MIALIQRVSRASVAVGGETAGEIGAGVLVLLGVERGDSDAEAARLAERVLGYRIFPDAAGKMNLSVKDVQGGLLVVPQFTLVAGELLRPTTLESVLAQPWSAGLETEIARDRVSAFNTSVWSPEGRRIQCSIAVYRSSTGARQILEHSNSRFRAFLAARHLGRPTPVRALGVEASAFRFDLGRLMGLAIGWRHRSVLATCSMLGRKSPALVELMVVVSAQQRRLATMLE